MKKVLQLLIFSMLFTTAVNAQTKVWDFGNNGGGFWPLSAGIATQSPATIVDGLGLYPSQGATDSNFGLVNANAWSCSTCSDPAYTSVNRFQLNGGGTSTAGNLSPTKRYVFMNLTNVQSVCNIKVYFRSGSGSAVRTVMVTNGTTLLGSGSSTLVDAATNPKGDYVIFTTNNISASDAAGTIYIYGDASASNLYKIEVTGATVNTTLANDKFDGNVTAQVFSNGEKISVANVTMDTDISVYSMTGALVKTINTNKDVDFDLAAGFYVVNVKTAEGQKSVKLSVR